MKDIDYYELGKRIRLRRTELGLSQETAAEKCGISPSFYSNIERGIKIMSLETFVSICKALSISADYLLSEELPSIDEVISNTLQEAKKSGTIQYEKYLRTIQALALVADHL
ncbi:helix-turn-helix domain-containing protein [Clostridium sp. MCC344]|nr:helix-turn-helix transcriptional regulator [Clostridium sp. MCC344]MBT9787890.1 helix-turn-helix domain-containing protein [Clostridium sp. MCC344]